MVADAVSIQSAHFWVILLVIEICMEISERITVQISIQLQLAAFSKVSNCHAHSLNLGRHVQQKYCSSYPQTLGRWAARREINF